METFPSTDVGGWNRHFDPGILRPRMWPLRPGEATLVLPPGQSYGEKGQAAAKPGANSDASGWPAVPEIFKPRNIPSWHLTNTSPNILRDRL